MTDDPVDALYALPLDEFVAARNDAAAQARSAGDRVTATRIRTLAKPTVAAWTVNQVTRDHPEDVERLLGIGAEMRAATAARDGATLAELNRTRRNELDAFVATVTGSGQVAGRTVTADTVRKLSETLEAAIIDPQSGEAVASGCLTRALQHVGFGVVDEDGAPADVVSLSAARAARRPALRVVSDHGQPGDTSAEERDGPSSVGTDDDTDAGYDAPALVAERALAEAEEEVAAAAEELDQAEGDRDAAVAAARAATESVTAATAALDRVHAEIAALEAERGRLHDELASAQEHAARTEQETRTQEDRLATAERRAEAARQRRREARATLRS